MGNGSSAEGTLTRFFIFEASSDRATWTYKGKQLARDRDHAARLFYGDSESQVPVEFCAVSENAWKPKRRKARLVAKIDVEDVQMPSSGLKEAAERRSSSAATASSSEPVEAPKQAALA